MNYLSFPGLGIEPFHIEPQAFSIFGHPVMWYGIIICVGMVLAFIYAMSRARFEGIKDDDMVDLGIFVILFGIIGARLYYILFSLDSFVVKGDFGKTLLNMVSIWNGGLAIYGAIIAGFITIVVVSKVKRIRTATLLDVVAPAVLIGQIVGRWGNFMNSEAYGSETTLPWRMGVLKSFDNGATFFSETYVHPTFLYESLWNLIGFILIAVFYKKKKFNGQVFLFYLSWYGFGRMFIEGLRSDSLMLGSIRVSQIVGAVTFAVGLVLMIVNLLKVKKYESRLANGSVSSLESSADAENSAENTAEDAYNADTANASDSAVCEPENEPSDTSVGSKEEDSNE